MQVCCVVKQLYDGYFQQQTASQFAVQHYHFISLNNKHPPQFIRSHLRKYEQKVPCTDDSRKEAGLFYVKASRNENVIKV